MKQLKINETEEDQKFKEVVQNIKMNLQSIREQMEKHIEMIDRFNEKFRRGKEKRDKLFAEINKTLERIENHK